MKKILTRSMSLATAAIMMLSLTLISCNKQPSPVLIPAADSVLPVFAVIEAEYPESAPYPDERSSNFDNEYSAWSDSNRERRKYYGESDAFTDFFRLSIREFLASENGENKVYSPLNVFMALAMLAEITDGESREEILNLLGTPDLETLRTKAHAVWNANYSDDGAVTSILASSLWMNDGIGYNKDTLSALAKNYFASSFSGKMGSKDYNDALHAWMNEQTGGLLSEHIEGISMTPETVLALVTTIYFQAKWEGEFSEKNTKPDIFHAKDGDVECDFMNQTEAYGSYYYTDGFSATKLALEGSGNMWFVLPDEGVGTEDLLENEKALALITGNTGDVECKTLRVNISLPKFDVNSKTDLKGGLMNLGVKSCFSSSAADFSPLTTDVEQIWLDKVEHGARVKVDEEGVSAAAYTVMMMCGAAMPPEDEIDFTLDRPFLFGITSSDGTPLFVGVVNTPN